MLSVPVTLTRVIVKFAPRFSKQVWEQVQVLVVGRCWRLANAL